MSKDVTQYIKSLDIAKYIKNDVIKLIEHVHTYKLNNIYSNHEFLTEYLQFIDKKNSLLMQRYIQNVELSSNPEDKGNTTENNNLGYYLSIGGANEIGYKYTDTSIFQSHKIDSIMTGIRGYIVLTIDEFCNATSTRIAINKLIMSMNIRKTMTIKK